MKQKPISHGGMIQVQGYTEDIKGSIKQIIVEQRNIDAIKGITQRKHAEV